LLESAKYKGKLPEYIEPSLSTRITFENRFGITYKTQVILEAMNSEEMYKTLFSLLPNDHVGFAYSSEYIV
jgi:hypothetical protein